MANYMIDACGPEAAGQSAAEMRRWCIEKGDMLAADAWLAVGSAIEDLTRLAAAETRH
jgi:hypothetical protein